MKTLITITHHFSFLLLFILTIMMPFHGEAQFQKHYGNALDNSFSKVIQDGTDYYILGSDEVVDGAPAKATVTRLDASGIHQWTLSMPILSHWADAVLLPGGDLMVVGYSLPFDASTKSIIGRVSQSGTFQWLKSYDQANRELFNRVVAQAGTYYVLGIEVEQGGTFDNVALWNFTTNGTLNWKKYYISSADDEFVRDLVAIPGGGLLMAGNDTKGVIYTTDNSGDMTTSAVSIANRVYRDVEANSSGGFYAAATNFPSGEAYLEKFNSELLLMWELRINEMNFISQVWEGLPGEVYVIGQGNFDSQLRTVIIKLVDDVNNGPAVSWAKYFHAGTEQAGGSAWLMPSLQLAYTDARVLPGGFGQACANISVSDLELSDACEVTLVDVSLLFTDPLPDGPPTYIAELVPAANPVDISGALTLDWEEEVTCSVEPCSVELQVTHLDNCGLVEVCANSTGPGPYSYQWCDGSTSNCVTTQLLCGTHDFCVTVTCDDGTTAVASTSVLISDITPPVAICASSLSVELDANCMANISVADIDENSFDDCLIDNMSIDQTSFNQCDTFIVTLEVEDWCGNVSTCTSTVIAEDKTAPTLTNCPSNMSVAGIINPMGVCEAVVQITSPLVSDNCDPAVSLTNSFNNTADASGTYPEGSTSVVWTATDACGNSASCSFGVTVQCDTCVCTPPDLALMTTGGFNFALACNELDPALWPVLPCQSGDVTISGDIGCTAMNGATSCPPQIIWTLSGPNGVITNGSSTSGSISQTFPASQISQPGNYTFVSTTLCPGALEACPCYINWVQESCDSCQCVQPDNLSFFSADSTNFFYEIAASCADTTPILLPCTQVPNQIFTYHGDAHCMPDSCLGSGYDWVVNDLTFPPTGILGGTGTFGTGGHFDIQLAYAQLTPGVLYEIVLTYFCDDEECTCSVRFILEECCCAGIEAFCEKLDNNITISINEDSCKASLNIGDIGCDSYIEWVQWASNLPPETGPYYPGDMPMYSYPGSGVYEICYLAIELDTNGMICTEKILCDTIDINCPACYCGHFSDMFIRTGGAPSLQAFCDSTALQLGCPQPGNSIQFTGSFQCAGPNCPPVAPVTWELVRMPGNIPVANNSTNASPYFGISILPAWYAVPGLYELRLTGHCGSQMCTCTIKFTVDCPDPCPCDFMQFEADVAKGFASINSGVACKACFAPIALNDCDMVSWHLGNINNPAIGTSTGNQTFCHTFGSSGTYTVIMVVTRKRADGSICEVFVYSRSVNVLCIPAGICTESVFANPGFNEEAIPGGLNSGGMSNGWIGSWGDPQVLEGIKTSLDGWTISLDGNDDTIDALTPMEPICLQRDTGMITLRAKDMTDYSRPRPCDRIVVGLQSDWVQGNLSIASISLSALDWAEWYDIQIPYDVSQWPELDACGSSQQGALVQPVVYVTNGLGEEQGGADTRSTAQIDHFCMDGMLLTTVNQAERSTGIRLFPNPTSGSLTIEFTAAVPRMGSVQVFDLYGRVMAQQLLHAGERQQGLSIAMLPDGVYFVKIRSNGMLIGVKKVVKQ